LPLPYPSKGCWHAWASSGPGVITPGFQAAQIRHIQYLRPSGHPSIRCALPRSSKCVHTLRAHLIPPPLLLLLLPNPNPLFWNTPLPLLRACCPLPAHSLPAAAPTISALCALDGHHPCAPLSLPLPTLLISAPVRDLRALLSPDPRCPSHAWPTRRLYTHCSPLNFCRSRTQFLPVSCSISTPCAPVARHYRLGRPHTRSSLMRAQSSPPVYSPYTIHTLLRACCTLFQLCPLSVVFLLLLRYLSSCCV
jgi:hypothetical protein